jgi:poly [ADP-ribose] polymerase
VGTTIGGHKLDKFSDKLAAMDNFLGVYTDKTGNTWNCTNFTKYPNKFYPLEIDYGQVHAHMKTSPQHFPSLVSIS